MSLGPQRRYRYGVGRKGFEGVVGNRRYVWGALRRILLWRLGEFMLLEFELDAG